MQIEQPTSNIVTRGPMVCRALGTLALLTLAVTFTPSRAEAQIESVRVMRIQLHVHTANESEAGTDAPVWVQLTGRSSERFWLSKGTDDRKRNQYDTWDVYIPSVRTIRDITQIQFGIQGSDKWCFDHVQLILNNVSTAGPDSRRVVFDKRGRFLISNKPSHRRLGVPNEIGIADYRELRSHRMWNLSAPRGSLLRAIPLRIPREILEANIEAILGDRMGPTGEYANLKWGKKRGRSHVQVSKKPGNARNQIHVDLDLNMSGRRSLFRAVDLDFTLTVEPGTNQVVMVASDIDPGLSRFLKGATLGIGVLGENVVRSFLPGEMPVAVVELPDASLVNPWFDNYGNLRVN